MSSASFSSDHASVSLVVVIQRTKPKNKKKLSRTNKSERVREREVSWSAVGGFGCRRWGAAVGGGFWVRREILKILGQKVGKVEGSSEFVF
jgi:hypothetical protein